MYCFFLQSISKFRTVCRLRVQAAETGIPFNPSRNLLHKSTLYAGRSLVFNSTEEVDNFNVTSEMTVKVFEALIMLHDT